MTALRTRYAPLSTGFVVVAAVFCAVLLMCGCGDRAGRMDERDLGHPLVKKALKLKQAGDFSEAAQILRQALDDRPDLARAHLELALLCDNPNGDDYIRAIYHYRRYLEKRPESEKRDIIEGLILGARLSYAATIPNQPSGSVDMIAKLKRENEALRERIRSMEQAGYSVPKQAPRAVSASADNDVKRLNKVEGAEPEPRYYVVRRSDSLSRIAREMYGDAAEWNRIYEANRDKLSSPESLRLGQKLLIPDL